MCREGECAGKGDMCWEGDRFVCCSMVSFLFTVVDTSAGWIQSSALYRAVACYVLTTPDLSRTRESKLIQYTMAQAFPSTCPFFSGPWFKSIWEQRCRGIHNYGSRYKFGSGLNAILDPTTTTFSSGVQISTRVSIASWSRTLWCGYWKTVTTKRLSQQQSCLSILCTCSWGLVPF